MHTRNYRLARGFVSSNAPALNREKHQCGVQVRKGAVLRCVAVVAITFRHTTPPRSEEPAGLKKINELHPVAKAGGVGAQAKFAGGRR